MMKFQTFCNNYDFECAAKCANDLNLFCVQELGYSIYSIINGTDLCARQCMGITYDTGCTSDSIETCGSNNCKQLLCDYFSTNNSIDCETQDFANLKLVCNFCESDACKDVDDQYKNVCVFINNVSSDPYIITQKSKCDKEQAASEDNAYYLLCDECENMPQSCCDKFCSESDDINQAYCISVQGNISYVTAKIHCQNLCNGIEMTEIPQSSCDDLCDKSCDTLDDTLLRYCFFEAYSTKSCLSQKDACLQHCSNALQITVDCSKQTDYYCFISYCNICAITAMNNSAVTCPKECSCGQTDMGDFGRM